MMTFKAIVIDDEEHARIALIDKLSVHCPQIKVVFNGGDPLVGITQILELKPDIVFLDIVMPGLNGLDVLNEIKNYEGEVIFVTAHDKYAVEAFQLCALGYLLKPVDTEVLINAVNHVCKRLQNSGTAGFDERLSVLLKLASGPRNKIAVPMANGNAFINISEIFHCEGVSKYSIIHYSDSRIVSSKNIGYFIDILSRYGFYSTHKSHLVNLDFVKSYTLEGEIVLTNGTRVPLSRRRKTNFIKQFKA